jgi:YHS domain-containing protein
MQKILALAAAALFAAACTAEKPADAPQGGGGAAKPALVKTTPSADYPLKTCVVSGKELGAMGKPVAYTYDGVEVQFCCSSCVDDFEADPAKYLAKLPAKPK